MHSWLHDVSSVGWGSFSPWPCSRAGGVNTTTTVKLQPANGDISAIPCAQTPCSVQRTEREEVSECGRESRSFFGASTALAAGGERNSRPPAFSSAVDMDRAQLPIGRSAVKCPRRGRVN